MLSPIFLFLFCLWCSALVTFTHIHVQLNMRGKKDTYTYTHWPNINEYGIMQVIDGKRYVKIQDAIFHNKCVMLLLLLVNFYVLFTVDSYSGEKYRQIYPFFSVVGILRYTVFFCRRYTVVAIDAATAADNSGSDGGDGGDGGGSFLPCYRNACIFCVLIFRIYDDVMLLCIVYLL